MLYDRVSFSTATTGTGTITAGAATSGFRTMAVAAIPDGTVISYAIEDGTAWETGNGTVGGTGTTLTRTLSASSTGSLLSLTGGAKVFITPIAADFAPRSTLITTPSDNLDDYAPSGFADAARLGINASATITLSGLAGGTDGREIVISNRSTEFLIVVEHQATGSLAINRFDLPNGFPMFLMPGDRISLVYSSTSSRWQANYASSNISQMGLTEFTDFGGANTPANNASVGPFAAFFNGTGASIQPSTFGVNATERAMGVIQCDTGTTTTGRAGIGTTGTDQIVPGLGCALSVSRLAVETIPTTAENFQAVAGFVDVGAAGVLSDGVFWRLVFTGVAAVWQRGRSVNGTPSVEPDTLPVDTNYVWLAVFINAAWTRADYLYSTDSINWVMSGSATTGIPIAAGRNSAFCAGAILKSAGTTVRNLSIDLAGYRVDYVRS